jgi:hypothetical protein
LNSINYYNPITDFVIKIIHLPLTLNHYFRRVFVIEVNFTLFYYIQRYYKITYIIPHVNSHTRYVVIFSMHEEIRI